MSPAAAGRRDDLPPDPGEHGRKLSRRAVLVGAGACVACAGAAFGVGRWVAARDDVGPGGQTRNAAQRRHAQPDAIFRVSTRKPMVALSFDDGPDPAYTPRVMELLSEHHASATFFHIGVNALVHRDLVKQHLDLGHTIGNHTYDHRELNLLPRPEVEIEIDRGESAIVESGSPRPTLFRPPKGYTDEVVGVLARAERYKTIFWDLCLEKFVNHHPIEAGVARMLDSVRPGMILLAHDGGRVTGRARPVVNRGRTMLALPLLLRGLDQRGLQVVDVPTLISNADPAGA